MEPIILNADESMMLLVTKGWEHKDVPILEDEGKEHYIQRVCNYRCFGHPTEYKADVWGCYGNLVEKLLSKRQLIRVIERSNKLDTFSQFVPLTFLEALFCELQFVQIKDTDKNELLVVLDHSEVKTEGKEHLVSFSKEKLKFKEQKCLTHSL